MEKIPCIINQSIKDDQLLKHSPMDKAERYSNIDGNLFHGELGASLQADKPEKL